LVSAMARLGGLSCLGYLCAALVPENAGCASGKRAAAPDGLRRTVAASPDSACNALAAAVLIGSAPLEPPSPLHSFVTNARRLRRSRAALISRTSVSSRPSAPPEAVSRYATRIRYLTLSICAGPGWAKSATARSCGRDIPLHIRGCPGDVDLDSLLVFSRRKIPSWGRRPILRREAPSASSAADAFTAYRYDSIWNNQHSECQTLDDLRIACSYFLQAKPSSATQSRLAVLGSCLLPHLSR
jgi:hypothetical protein